jgi:hypothetical protein
MIPIWTLSLLVLIYNICLLLHLGLHALTSKFIHRVGRVIMGTSFLLFESFGSGTHGTKSRHGLIVKVQGVNYNY